MSKFKDMYIISDMDGTLINSQHKIDSGNIDAINYFVENGGTFSVATGRASEGIINVLDKVNVNGHCVVANGAAIYDLSKKTVVESGSLDTGKLIPFVQKQIDKYPGLCLQIYTEKGLYVLSNTQAIDEYLIRDRVPHVLSNMYDMLDLTWHKMLFHSGVKSAVEAIAKTAFAELEGIFEMNFSSETYFEIIPIGFTKGDSMNKIRKMEEYKDKKFIALGDHLNDVHMLEEADFSVSPKNAAEGAKDACNLVADVSNDGCLLKWVIEKLEQGKLDL